MIRALIRVFKSDGLYTTKERAIQFVFVDALKARWVVSMPSEDGHAGGEMGLRIAGVNLWYYKWPEPMLAPSYEWRIANKR